MLLMSPFCVKSLSYADERLFDGLFDLEMASIEPSFVQPSLGSTEIFAEEEQCLSGTGSVSINQSASELVDPLPVMQSDSGDVLIDSDGVPTSDDQFATNMNSNEEVCLSDYSMNGYLY